jgi:hypothetical protein
MRSLLLISGLCVLISGTAFAQKTDRERDGLKGPVKTVRVRQATILSKHAKESESPILLTHEVTYDQSGNRMALVLYDQTGRLSRRIEYQSDQYDKTRRGLITYNSQNVIVRNVADKYGSNGFKVSRTIQDFNEDGTLFKKTELTFGALGELIEVTEYQSDGSLIKKERLPLEPANREIALTSNPRPAEDIDRVISFGRNAGEYFDPDLHGNWTRGRTGSTFRTYASGEKVKTTEWAYREFIYY